jgi:branched-chain amino acid transport system substrate-binding protein
VNKYDELYGKLPGYYAPVSYTAAQWIAQALEDVDGNVDDKEAFLAAIRSVEFADTPMGPLSLDDYDNSIENVYIRETRVRDDGRIWNEVVDTIPSVSQFWTYNPEEYLAQPVYSRDYQGIDWP